MKFWGNFINVFKRELEIFKKTKLLWFVVIILPLLFSFVTFEVFKNATPENLPFAVVDNDNTELSRKYIRMLDATSSLEVKYYFNDLKTAKEALSSRKIYGFVFIPNDFQADIQTGKVPDISYYYNNQTLLTGGIITKDVVMTTRVLMGEIKVQKLTKHGLSKKNAIENINLINTDEHILSNPYLNYSYFLSLPFLMHALQMLVMFCAIWTLGVELKKGSAKAFLDVAGESLIAGYFGKMALYFLIYLSVFSAVYIIYFGFYQGIFNGSILTLILSTAAFIFSYQALAVVFIALTSNLRMSLSCAAFYTALGMAFVGVTYPDFAMPLPAKIFGSLMPLKYYLRIVLDQTVRNVPWVYDIGSFISILLLTIFGLLFLPRLKYVLKNKEFWHKI